MTEAWKSFPFHQSLARSRVLYTIGYQLKPTLATAPWLHGFFGTTPKGNQTKLRATITMISDRDNWIGGKVLTNGMNQREEACGMLSAMHEYDLEIL